jgi:regulator of replication initiation timing
MYSKVRDIPEELLTLPLEKFNQEYKKWGKIPRPTLMKKRKKLQRKLRMDKKELEKALKCIDNLQNQASILYEEKMEALENYNELKDILFGLYENGIHIYYYPGKGYITKKENRNIFKYFNIF